MVRKQIDSIEEQLLNIFVKYLNGILSDNSDNFLGIPPRLFYIDYGVFIKRKDEYVLSEVLKKYKYESGGLEETQINTKRQIEPLSGMYFREGYASIGINSSKSMAFFSFHAGPRYGIGFKYDIIKDESGMHLGEEKTLWVS